MECRSLQNLVSWTNRAIILAQIIRVRIQIWPKIFVCIQTTVKIQNYRHRHPNQCFLKSNGKIIHSFRSMKVSRMHTVMRNTKMEVIKGIIMMKIIGNKQYSHSDKAENILEFLNGWIDLNWTLCLELISHLKIK